MTYANDRTPRRLRAPVFRRNPPLERCQQEEGRFHGREQDPVLHSGQPYRRKYTILKYLTVNLTLTLTLTHRHAEGGSRRHHGVSSSLRVGATCLAETMQLALPNTS